ncbi:hypothetical protein GQ457_03G017360 [Hibiscus cannabinus]
MAPDSLLHQFDDLNFTAEEQDVVFAPTSTVVIPEEDPRLSLVGRVITAHELDGVSLIRVFRAVWKPTKVLSITELQSIFFLIRLASEEVRSDILKRGPRVFNDDWFVILPLNPLFSIDEYFFTNIIIWVRILRVQIGLMSESLGRSLGACIGSVVGTDMRIIDGNMGEFMRVRINIDVTKPLRRCVALGGCGTKPRLCPLQYEKLPNFCHGCGLIGHLVIDCPRQPHDPQVKFQYGDCLEDAFAFMTKPVGAAPEFDAIEEWLSGDNDFEVPVPTYLPVKIPAKRSSGGSDPSKSKRARSIPITLSSKDLRILKAGMSSSKNSSAVVDKQPRRGK